MTPRVVVADATAFIRLAARVALMQEGIPVKAEVASAAEADEAVRLQDANVLLLDSGLDPEMVFVSELHRAHPDLAIIVLSLDADDEAALAAVRAGAAGFIPKDTMPERLPRIVRGVIGGEAAIPRRLVRRLLDELVREVERTTAATDFAAGAGLSFRETQVIALLADGVPDSQVAERLRVSEVTVRRHVSAARGKIGVSRRVDAIERWRSMGRAGRRVA